MEKILTLKPRVQFCFYTATLRMFLLVTGDTFPLCIGPSDELKAPRTRLRFWILLVNSLLWSLISSWSVLPKSTLGSDMSSPPSRRRRRWTASPPGSRTVKESDIRNQAIRKSEGDDSGPRCFALVVEWRRFAQHLCRQLELKSVRRMNLKKKK